MIRTTDVSGLDLAERLQRYARFVALVAEQLEAVREDDGERLRRLSQEREALEHDLTGDGIFDAGEPSTDGSAPEITEIDALAGLHDELELALASLDERFVSQRWTEEQLVRLSDGAIRSARSVPMVRSLARNYPDLEARTTRVDRRF